MSDMLDAMLGDAPAHAPASSEAGDANAAPPAEQAGGPSRGADGKFAAKVEPDAAAQAQAPAAAPAQGQDPASPPPGHVPAAAMHDWRRQAQEAKAELERLRGGQQQQPVQPQAPPSVFEDEAYTEYQGKQLLNMRLDMSEDMARTKHGDEAVDKLQGWFKERSQQSPAFHQEVISQRNPYEYAMARMTREATIDEIQPDELAQFKAWKAAQADAQGNPPAGQQPAFKAPSPSLASAPSAGGVQHVPVGAGQAFDQTFK